VRFSLARPAGATLLIVFAAAFLAGAAGAFLLAVAFLDPDADFAEVFALDFAFDVAICRTPSRDGSLPN
jgi:hypothetical protein